MNCILEMCYMIIKAILVLKFEKDKFYRSRYTNRMYDKVFATKVGHMAGNHTKGKYPVNITYSTVQGPNRVNAE